MNTITIDRGEYDRLVADSEMLADVTAFDVAMKDLDLARWRYHNHRTTHRRIRFLA